MQRRENRMLLLFQYFSISSFFSSQNLLVFVCLIYVQCTFIGIRHRVSKNRKKDYASLFMDSIYHVDYLLCFDPYYYAKICWSIPNYLQERPEIHKITLHCFGKPFIVSKQSGGLFVTKINC